MRDLIYWQVGRIVGWMCWAGCTGVQLLVCAVMGFFLSLDMRDGKVQIGIDGLVAGIADIRVVGGVEAWRAGGGKGVICTCERG